MSCFFVSLVPSVVFVRQAEFLNHAVEAILALYNSGGKGGAAVESVMVVGHSLGGLITR